MGLWKQITERVLGTAQREQQERQALLRRCYFEVMEQRRVLSADPVIAAITYLEGDAGQDTTPDHFEVTFEGGSATTSLTQFTINGDQDLSGGLSDGDMFFDVNAELPGAGGNFPFAFDAANSRGITAEDVRSVEISADGLRMTVQVENFEAGDVLAFTVDVDEVERFRTDKIASGVEFEGTLFEATFVDAHYVFESMDLSLNAELQDGYVQLQQEGIFYDEYDQLLAAGESAAQSLIELARDNELQSSNRTAAAIDAYELVEKPITISGTVYHDDNLNCHQDVGETGIAGVQIELQRWDSSAGAYQTVARTVTDAAGNYEFGTDLNLKPGDYQLVETQPEGFLDVGAESGSHGGQVALTGENQQNVISSIQIPLGGTVATDYDFCETLPATLSGHVWHDQDNDGIFDAGEQGIANVLIEVRRIGSKTGTTNDPFAGTAPVQVRTDGLGYYQAEQLPPGLYEVIEINNYPVPEINPLTGYLDGKDAAGTVAAAVTGVVTNDRITDIELCAGDEGINYNFGELLPVQISGHVGLTTPSGDCVNPADPAYQGLAGVTIELYNEQGQLVASTLTDSAGAYAFADLNPGTYTLVEVQPAGYLDGGQELGTANGQTVGQISGVNRFADITLASGVSASGYDFCETLPAELCGTVYHDRNNNGQQDSGEEGIAGVRIVLTDAQGQVLAEQLTDAAGNYCFQDLYPGEYCVKEIQPVGYLDGKDSVGSVNGFVQGELVNDQICQVTLRGGETGSDYNFGEIQVAQISGQIHVDANGDCVYQPADGEYVLANVELQLLDAQGQVVATTMTDAQGFYVFDNLLPGEYSIVEVQPEGYFSGGQQAGSAGGLATENLIQGIIVGSGQQAGGYDFCEVEPAEIHGRVWEDGPAIETEDGGPISGYRGLRDGVYTPGEDTPLAGVRMQLYYFIDPVNGSTIPRAVTVGEVLAGHYDHLGTEDPHAAIWVETMANGEYWFTGLPAGNYIVLETQPEGYYDGNDSAGTTSGFSFNSLEAAATAPQSVISTFSAEQIMDSVVNIRVNAGDISQLNNFSELRFEANPEQPPLNPPSSPPPRDPVNPIPQLPGITAHPGLYGAQFRDATQLVGSSRGAFATEASGGYQPFTWHLSVINAGQPRNLQEAAPESSVWTQAAFLNNDDWSRFDMSDVVWTFTRTDESGELQDVADTVRFGMIKGTPLAGDFDGDGVDEVAIFKDGYWMIDINRNGTWDEGDLLAKLGDEFDRPVVGDWDGDGKDDIGIFGPMWERDREAIAQEPGLPNPDNVPYTRPKNVPPVVDDATNGARVMKLTSYGRQRVDVVDHVFGLSDEYETPVTGDWNGNGVRSIGTFEGGVWKLDVNGDGRFDDQDLTADFGRTGDVPLVGDFDGDGIEEIAIYRSGTWIIDSNGNRVLDDGDRTFEMGGVDDTPIVGDWDGDGIDEPGLVREDPNRRVD